MKKILSAVIALGFALSLYCQPRTGYFVESFTLNHQMNPAFVPNQGYVGIPMLSNIGVNINSNLGASHILYPLESGKVGLFLHPQVSSDEFLGKLSDVNYLDGTVGLDIINVGWFTGKSSFWSIDAGVKVSLNSSLPKEFFRFVKQGMSGDSNEFNMSNIGADGDVYTYISLGYSSSLDKLVKGLRIGGKVKFLAGLMNIYAHYDNLHVSADSQKWNVVGNGTGYILGGGVDFTYDSQTGVVNGVQFDPSSFGIGGVGGAIDLGIQYRISEGCALDGLRFSAAVTDLGFISYFKNKSTLVSSDGFVEYDGFDEITQGGDILEDQLDELLDRAMTLVSFTKQPVDDNQITRITTKVNAGIDYSFLKDKMNVGVLYTGYFSKIRERHEIMASFNYAPANWFDVAVSYSFMNLRSSFGWLLTFTPKKGMNFYLGSDYTVLRYTPQGIPLDKAYFGINLGLSVPIGDKR